MEHIELKPPGEIHLIGICGTGMGALAGLLVKAGYTVTGSDAHPYPPMSTELASLGIPVFEGYRASNLEPPPDLVVVGNVCRRDHPEAAAARESGIPYVSMPRAVHDIFLAKKKPLVICGTHGKTTTTSLTAYLLEATGRDPSVLVGGITADFGAGYKLGAGDHFVIEGDEYDSAYFEKVPKFMSYAPFGAVITSVEYDHVDIYPTEDDYRRSFENLVELVGAGTLAVYAGDETAARIAEQKSNAVLYAVEGDPGHQAAAWRAIPSQGDEFTLEVDGSTAGVWRSPMAGRHNLRNTLAALIMAHSAAKVPLEELRSALPGFGGVARRQQVVAEIGGVTIYDDFAHHPTAVKETIQALAKKHSGGRIFAAFEPRSATACRKTHQTVYPDAFKGAHTVAIAPVGRDLPRAEILDTAVLAEDLRSHGVMAMATAGVEEIVELFARECRPNDALVFMSNGAFGGIHDLMVEALS